MRGLGSRQTRSNDMLSLLMFQPDYIARLIELGEADAGARGEEIEAFIRTDGERGVGAAGRGKPARRFGFFRRRREVN